MRRPALWAAATCFMALAGCGANREPDRTSGPLGSSATASGTYGADDVTAGGEDKLDLGAGDSSGSTGSGEDCNAASVQGELETTPVDIIMVVDTSPTMGDGVDQIESLINLSFAQIIEASGLDYRIIAIAQHGSGDEAICVGAPLSGTDCNPPPPAPANSARFFHYNRGTGSGSMLPNILAWYTAPDPSGQAPGGWSKWVRPTALKTFLVFSDTDQMPNNTAEGTQFHDQLLALAPDQFGTPDDIRYTMHVIGGFNAPNAPVPPDAPIIDNECNDDATHGPGQALQQVAVLSGGFRFEMCALSQYELAFNVAAQGVVEETPVACSIPIPDPPAGETIDPDTIEVEYFDGETGALAATFHQVHDLAACEPDAFYIEADTVHLCPDACELVQADLTAKVTVRYGCDVGYVPPG